MSPRSSSRAMLLAAGLLAAACADEGPPALCYAPDTMSTAELCDRLPGACDPATGAPPALSEAIQVVPGAAMPEGVVSQTSHNNLDIAWFDNRLFFAFRTAPTHFASADTVLYVVSTADQQTWTLETHFTLTYDLREPRFLALGDRLLMYFAVLGYNPTAFEPQYTLVTEYEGPCAWSEPTQIFEPTFIPWRTKAIDGVGYLMGYIGGENIYEADGEPVRVHWLRTTDGRTFEPVVAGQPVVLEGGSSETDFVFTDDGAVVAVSRNELGDELGWGSKICRAEPGALGDWTCAADPRKYDSPLLFSHRSGIYLIGRRNLTETGHFDLGRRDLPPAEQASLYNREYWTEPKRCSLWQVDPDALTVDFVLDLPSNGDTCFASALPLNDRQFLVYNYTSPLDDPELSWASGQFKPTSIYRLTLTLP